MTGDDFVVGPVRHQPAALMKLVTEVKIFIVFSATTAETIAD